MGHRIILANWLKFVYGLLSGVTASVYTGVRFLTTALGH